MFCCSRRVRSIKTRDRRAQPPTLLAFVKHLITFYPYFFQLSCLLLPLLLDASQYVAHTLVCPLISGILFQTLLLFVTLEILVIGTAWSQYRHSKFVVARAPYLHTLTTYSLALGKPKSHIPHAKFYG